jgi:thiosulfate/3-mercaptopyruvate sulfurtransferase
MGRSLRYPDALVTTGWLADHLHDPDLRIFDCSTVLQFEEGGKRPYRVLNCADEHRAGHIPGAHYFDLQRDFSEDDSPFGMTLAAPETVAAAFESAGIGDGTRVILYSRRSPSWATRFWWMLRWLGFDNASVLDGGFEKWVAEDRPQSTDASTYPRGNLSVRLRPEVFVGKDEVRASIGNPATCLVNALGRDVFSGENPRYGRPGRIPGSINVPQAELVDPKTHAFLPPEEISHAFERAAGHGADRYITYCGGGIFATVDAFWLHQFGYDDVAVYENSMSEWGPDESLPIQADQATV